MNMGTLSVAFLVSFAGFAQVATADIAPVTTIECQSNNPSYPFELRGEFHQIANRHGAGYMNFTVTLPNGQFRRSGMGQSWSTDSIDYSDSNARAFFLNAYSPMDASTLTINGHSETMVCQIKNPTPSARNPYYRNGH